jgi:hypothetical protein
MCMCVPSQHPQPLFCYIILCIQREKRRTEKNRREGNRSCRIFVVFSFLFLFTLLIRCRLFTGRREEGAKRRRSSYYVSKHSNKSAKLQVRTKQKLFLNSYPSWPCLRVCVCVCVCLFLPCVRVWVYFCCCFLLFLKCRCN